jgi:hypothetical protein
MNNGTQITIQDAIQKLTLYGLKECTKEMRSQYNIECLYAFECLDDEDGTYLICGTEDDVFVLLSLVEESALQ